MASIYMTMYFSHISGVNVGVITTMWAIQPLFTSLIDYIINREVVNFNYIVGMLFILLGAVLIGIKGIMD